LLVDGDNNNVANGLLLLAANVQTAVQIVNTAQAGFV